jgi:hypothetical protein
MAQGLAGISTRTDPGLTAASKLPANWSPSPLRRPGAGRCHQTFRRGVIPTKAGSRRPGSGPKLSLQLAGRTVAGCYQDPTPSGAEPVARA